MKYIVLFRTTKPLRMEMNDRTWTPLKDDVNKVIGYACAKPISDSICLSDACTLSTRKCETLLNAIEV